MMNTRSSDPSLVRMDPRSTGSIMDTDGYRPKILYPSDKAILCFCATNLPATKKSRILATKNSRWHFCPRKNNLFGLFFAGSTQLCEIYSKIPSLYATISDPSWIPTPFFVVAYATTLDPSWSVSMPVSMMDTDGSEINRIHHGYRCGGGGLWWVVVGGGGG